MITAIQQVNVDFLRLIHIYVDKALVDVFIANCWTLGRHKITLLRTTYTNTDVFYHTFLHRCSSQTACLLLRRCPICDLVSAVPVRALCSIYRLLPCDYRLIEYRLSINAVQLDRPLQVWNYLLFYKFVYISVFSKGSSLSA